MVKSMNAALRIPHFGYADEVQISAGRLPKRLYLVFELTLCVINQVEMDQLYQLRQQFKPLAEAKGIKLSFMPFIIKVRAIFRHVESISLLTTSLLVDIPL